MPQQLVTFNSLPPKPEHVSAIESVLARKRTVTLSVLLELTGLSKTQAMCALNALMSTGTVEKDKGRYIFHWIGDLPA